MSKYAKAHETPAGPGDARPTALQILHDESLENGLKDKVCSSPNLSTHYGNADPPQVFLVTGASAGLGIETGRALAATGARVFLAVRSLDKGRAACASYLEPGRVELLELDTSSLASVRAAAADFLTKSSKLNVLVCNAGIMMTPQRELSEDGFELQLATNYIGHFLLFSLLKDTMLASSTPEFNSRLVNVSSAGHNLAEIQFDDINFSVEGSYEPTKAYAQSKLAQIYMANYVERTFGPRGLHALSVMPGGIRTNLQQHIPQDQKDGWDENQAVVNFFKSPEQGAATTLVAAISKEWEGKGGKYLEDCQAAKHSPLIPFTKGVAEYAYDEAKETKLWDMTLDLLKLK